MTLGEHPGCDLEFTPDPSMSASRADILGLDPNPAWPPPDAPTIRLEPSDGSYGPKVRVAREGSDLFLDLDYDIATMVDIEPGTYALVRIEEAR